MSIEILRDHIAGALYGVAVGDALGGPVEFMTRGQIAAKYGGPVDRMAGGGWLGLVPGETTDDTAMTLAVAEGIMANPDDPAQEIGRRFISWANSRPKDIGATCASSIAIAKNCAAKERRAIPDFIMWSFAAHLTAEHNGDRSGGNGALMRCIYPALYYTDRLRAVREAVNQGRMTHKSADSDDACLFYADVVHYLVRHAAGSDDAKALRESAAGGLLVSHICNMASGTPYKIKDLPDTPEGLRPSGYCVDSLKCAMYAWAHTTNFKAALVTAVNLGGDADTIGAICGGLCGAVYGYNDIPAEWIAYLSEADRERLNAAVAAAVENWKEAKI